MPEPDAYAPETILTDLLGEHSKPLILASLLATPTDWLTKTDIAHLAGLSPRTVSRHIDTLEKHSIVRTRPSKDGYIVYQINKENPGAKQLAKLEWELIDTLTEPDSQP